MSLPLCFKKVCERIMSAGDKATDSRACVRACLGMGAAFQKPSDRAIKNRSHRSLSKSDDILPRVRSSRPTATDRPWPCLHERAMVFDQTRFRGRAPISLCPGFRLSRTPEPMKRTAILSACALIGSTAIAQTKAPLPRSAGAPIRTQAGRRHWPALRPPSHPARRHRRAALPAELALPQGRQDPRA